MLYVMRTNPIIWPLDTTSSCKTRIVVGSVRLGWVQRKKITNIIFYWQYNVLVFSQQASKLNITIK